MYWISISVILFFLLGCNKVNEDCNANVYPNAPELEWHTEASGSGEEAHGHFIMTCSDGGYLQIGETGFIPDSAKVLVVKTNNLGSVVWQKEFSSGGHNLGNSAIEASDGYIICGALNENSTLIKLDKNSGNEIFNQSVDNGGSDAFEHLALSTTGMIAVGYINANDITNTFYTEGEAYLTFLDSNGLKLNGLSLNNFMSHAYRIQSYNEYFFIAGLTEDASEFALIKIDNQGNVIWNKTFGGTKSDHCFGMDISDNGYIFLTGHTLSGTVNWDTYTMKIDPNGELVWEAKAGNPRGFAPEFIHDEAWGLKCTADGGCIIVAGTGDEYGQYKRRCGNNGDDSNTWHVYLIKFDSNGSIEWEKTYGGGEGLDWAGEDIDLTADGGAIVAVDNGQFGFLKIKPFQ